MHIKLVKILPQLFSLLTSKYGIVLVLFLFIVCPVITMSNSVLTSTSQVLEEEHSEQEPSEDGNEDLLKLFSNISKITFATRIQYIRIQVVRSYLFSNLYLDILIPPPKFI